MRSIPGKSSNVGLIAIEIKLLRSQSNLELNRVAIDWQRLEVAVADKQRRPDSSAAMWFLRGRRTPANRPDCEGKSHFS
jgi:hypothetical protein